MICSNNLSSNQKTLKTLLLFTRDSHTSHALCIANFGISWEEMKCSKKKYFLSIVHLMWYKLLSFEIWHNDRTITVFNNKWKILKFSKFDHSQYFYCYTALTLLPKFLVFAEPVVTYFNVKFLYVMINKHNFKLLWLNKKIYALFSLVKD